MADIKRKINFCWYIIVLFFLLYDPIAHSTFNSRIPPLTTAQNHPQAKNEKKEAEIIDLQTALKTLFSLLTKLHHVNEDTLGMLHKGQIRIKDAEKAIRIMTEIRMHMIGIIQDQTNLISSTKPEELRRYCCMLIDLTEKLAAHFDAIVDSGFQEFKPFDFAKFFNPSPQNKRRPIDITLSTPLIKKKLAAVSRIVSDVHEKEEYAHLTWYNILTRKFEKNVVTPWYKYNMGTIVKVTLSSTAVVTFVLWQAGSNYLQNQMLIEYKKFLQTKSGTNLLNEFPELAHAYGFKNDELQSGELYHALDPRNGTRLSIREPFRGKDNGDYKFLTKDDIAFIEAAFKEHISKIFSASKLKRFLKFLPDKIGWPEPLSSFGHLDTDLMAQDPIKYGILSSAFHFADQSIKHQFGILTLLGGFTLNLYKETWGDGMPGTAGAVFAEKAFDLWNFLRGGAHLQQSLSLDFDPTLTFKDVIGLKEVKEELMFLLSFIENPEMFIRSGKIPERGYLLTGPTRSGKSYIVEALCGEINKRLKALGRGKEFKFRKLPPALIAHVGIDRILAWAKSEAPVILWIDEIDLLDLQRVGDKKTLMGFLTGMGNSFDNDPNKLVIIIGCTNRPENMDFALKQHGRFGKEIRFEYPAAKYRRKFIVKQLTSMGLDPQSFDIESLTYKTEGQNFESIKAVIKCTSVKAWMRGVVIDQELLDEVFDTEIRHILPVERKKLSDSEREILATFFAGKALAHALLETRGILDRVTIRPIMVKLEETWVYEHLTDKEKQARGDDHKIQYGQVFTRHTHDTAKINTHEQALNEIKLLVAGFAAEEVMYGASTYSCHPEDSANAYKLAENIAFEGLDKARLGSQQVKKLASDAYELKKRCFTEVKKLLEEYKPALIKIAEALKKHSTLSDHQVLTILENAMVEAEESAIATTQEDSNVVTA